MRTPDDARNEREREVTLLLRRLRDERKSLEGVLSGHSQGMSIAINVLLDRARELRAAKGELPTRGNGKE